MLTKHTRKKVNIFGFFSRFCQFLFDFSYANFYLVSCKILKAVKDRVWYKLPLVGVLPQASFRLTAVGWGWTQPNGSRPSTPPVSAVVAAPCCGSFCMCVAASSELTRCAGLATRRCWWCARSARPSVESEWRNLWTRPNVWRRSGVHWSWN